MASSIVAPVGINLWFFLNYDYSSSEVLYYACRLRERKTLSYILKSIILAIVKASNMRISYIEFAQQHQVSVQI